jgi:putative transcriptional regulator
MVAKMRQLRIKRGMSLSHTAKHMGITKNVYANIESGRRNPSWEVAQCLEQFLGIPVSKLLAREEEKHHDLMIK